MKSLLLSLFSLATLTVIVFAADQRVEGNLRRIALRDKVSFSIGSLTDETNFSKLADMDERKIDTDLAKYKIQRISDAFISQDGRYVMTFARDVESNTIKRVLFFYEGGETRGYADDVLDVNRVEIKTTKGSVRIAGESLFISD